MKKFDKEYNANFDELAACMRECLSLRREIEQLNGKIWHLAYTLEMLCSDEERGENEVE